MPDDAVVELKRLVLASAPSGLFTPSDLSAAAAADAADAAGAAPADPAAAAAALLSAASLNRFVRAAAGDVRGAAKRVIATARWRTERSPGAPCPLCVVNPGSHYMSVRFFFHFFPFFVFPTNI